MIKNERQYRITKAQAEEFRSALASNAHAKSVDDPIIAKALTEAVKSQLDELDSQIAEYHILQSGKTVSLAGISLADLPIAFIKARIALGLTQGHLAKMLKVAEQQVQRWEASNYSGASLKTLGLITKVLGIQIREEVFVPMKDFTPRSFMNGLLSFGIAKDLLRRILPPGVIGPLTEEKPNAESFPFAFQAANIIERVLGIPTRDLLSGTGGFESMAGASAVRFKKPASAAAVKVNAQALYAHFVGILVESCCFGMPKFALQSDPLSVRKALLQQGAELTFENLLRFAWASGVIVFPVKLTGGFHGAVWRVGNRYMVALKQGTEQGARWLFDLLHELGHIAKGHLKEADTLIEEKPISEEATEARMEQEANEWAQKVIFGNEIDAIEESCRTETRGKLQFLKSVLPQIASRYKVPLGSLANHLAYRLREADLDWWGTAQNLQRDGNKPFVSAADEVLRHITITRLNPQDREMLTRALTEE